MSDSRLQEVPNTGERSGPEVVGATLGLGEPASATAGVAAGAAEAGFETAEGVVLGVLDSVVEQLSGLEVSGLGREGLARVIAGAGRVMAVSSSLQARCAVAIEGLGDGGVDSKTVLRESGRMSTRAARSTAVTASGLAEMPKLAESLASGDISVEHAAAAVSAAAKTSPDQVEQELAGLAEGSSVDAFTKHAQRWANRNQTGDGKDAHEAKRRNRSLADWVNQQGMGVICAELDPTSYQQARNAINCEYDRLWRNDGGRDGKPDDVRTPKQRRADAFMSLLTNVGSRGPGSPRMQLTAIVDIERLQQHKCDDSGHGNPRGEHRNDSHGDSCRGDGCGELVGAAQIIGGEALPQNVLERLGCMSTVTGVIFDGDGEPIWVGRDQRHATPAQVKAIIARDQHCGGCDAEPARCEVHHIVPWQHGGHTNTDDMCLACPRCHHNIHDHGYIVIKTSTGYKIINPNNPPNGP